jgi:Leucine-rich repeat (LRR) protein
MASNLVTGINSNYLIGSYNLEFLDLSGNKFTALNASMFRSFTGLKTLHMSNNPTIVFIEKDSLKNSSMLKEIKFEKCNLNQNVPSFPGICFINLIFLFYE